MKKITEVRATMTIPHDGTGFHEDKNTDQGHDGAVEHERSTPQLETAEQRRERLVEAISDAVLRYCSSSLEPGDAASIADAVIDSDRAAGDDPEALHSKLREALASGEKWYLERDEERAEVERLTKQIANLEADISLKWQPAQDRLIAKRDEAMDKLRITSGILAEIKSVLNLERFGAEIERLKGELQHYRDPAMQPSQRYWEGRWRDAVSEREELAARLAVATEALKRSSRWFAVVAPHDAVRHTINSAIINLPARAKAMLRVIEEARSVTLPGYIDRREIEVEKLCMAVDALDGRRIDRVQSER